MNEQGGAIAPDHLADCVTAFRVGRTLAPPASSAPTLDELTNAVTGRLAIADSAQREQAVRRAELFGAIGVGLGGTPYAQRASILAHLAPALTSEGIPPEVIAKFDPTDEALAMSIDRAQAAARLLGAS